MADLTNITPLNPDNFSSEVYQASDESLISQNVENNTFDPETDYVEYLVYDLNNTKIRPSGNDATFVNYTLLDNQIYIDPEKDLVNAGIDNGIVNSVYNFYKKRLASSPQSTYYIKEISSNRTEIRLDSNIISRAEIASTTAEFIAYREADETFPDFYLNLGSNLLFIANNIRLADDGTILVKLYEPLPSNIELKTSLWVVEKISEGLAYRVEFNDFIDFKPQYLKLRGPNFNLNVKDEINNSSEAISLDELNSPDSQTESQVNSYLNNPGINVNVDYTDFSTFVHFSSAESRIRNFFSKVELIQSASAELAIQDVLTNNISISSSKAELSNLINDTITNFDGFEYYLYFESSSITYPKSNTTPPYINGDTTSVVAQTWVTQSILDARDYDEFNKDYLYYAIPEYIREDSDNAQYMTFIDMIGHYFDDYVWVYIQDTTNKFDADNRIDYGVSKDLVAQTIREFGIKLYQNNYSTSDLYSAFLGFTSSGSLFPFPYMTGSLPTPEGYEYVDTFMSSSDSAIPLDDINKRIYKRIYHNLPYLLKKKGTIDGLKTLVNIYGIPDTILGINEFGGKDKNNENDWDLWKHIFNYSHLNEDANYINTEWVVNNDWGSTFTPNPSSLQFRFNAGLAENAPASQSLWSLDGGNQVKLVLEYDTTLPTTSGSYSGSIIDPEYQYATLKFTTDDFTTSASILLPFYNNDWWSVQINRNERDNWELLAGNKIYSGSDGSQIGFIASSSVTSSPITWEAASSSWFGTENGAGIAGYDNFTGNYQEIRYFNQAISQSVFKDYVMNPQSFEGNGIDGAYDQLIFRAALGSELFTEQTSIHPKISGSNITQSFTSDSNFTISKESFVENKEWVLLDSPAVGIKNRNNDKIKQQNVVLPNPSPYKVIGANLPLDTTLSNLDTIQQNSPISGSYTNDVNVLELGFSPQNEINDDIIGQIGHFNIGEYIGDPREVSSSLNTYPQLDGLRDEYFSKYIKNYDLNDFVRLIKFFDNSLFKMVKDFVPARTALASGIIIKQHILERQKYPQPQMEWERYEYTGSIGQTPTQSVDGQREYLPSGEYESNPLEEVEGGNGGSIITTDITQSWDGINVTPLGDVPFTQDDEREFVNGEFSGSAILAEDGELNPDNTSKRPSTIPLVYDIDLGASDFTVVFPYTPPSSGELYWNGEKGVYDRGAYPIYITSIDINEVDKNGLNIEDALSKLGNDTLITFRAKARFRQQLPTPSNQTLDKTFTVPVSNITGLTGGDAWRIEFPTPLILGYVTVNIDIVDNTLISDYPLVIDPLIFEGSGFTYSDDNALLNNATKVTPSLVYYDLDYSQGSITPVNFDAIISGSAPKAQIQDYNYSTRRSIIPRYSGSKNTSKDYNIEGGTIDTTQALFGYFNWVGGTSPEWGNGIEDRSVVNLRFLLDVNGKIIKPIADSQGINQGIVEQNFTEDKIATLAFDDEGGSSSNFSNLLGNHTIFKSGKTIAPIVYSQTASIAPNATGGYTGSLEFVQGDQQEGAGIGDYRLTAFSNGTQLLFNDDTSVEFDFEQYLGALGTFTSNITYQTQTIDPNGVGVTLEFKVQLEPEFTGPDYNNTFVTFQFEKNGTLVGNSVTLNWGNSNTVSLSYVDNNISNTDSILLKAVTVDFDQGGTPTLSNNSFFKVIQTPPPSIGAVGPDIGPSNLDYWQKLGAIGTPGSFKFKPNALLPVYGQKQKDIDGSGFFKITNDFILEVGDEIRFQGTETQTYKIVEVDNLSSPPIFTVNKGITLSNDEMDWFLVRRYIDNPANIILEVDKSAGGTSPGILKPQYLSKDVENNIDNILEQLRRDALI